MEFQFLEEAESQTSPQQNAGGLQFEYIQGAQEATVEPEPREFFSFEDAVSAIGTIPEALAVGVPAAYQKLVTGLEIPEKSEAIESELAFQQRIQTEQADRVASGKATTFGSAIREALPSLGFSVLPMAAAIPAGIGGTMVGGPAAPVTGPAAAMAASGTVAYRMAGSDMMYRAYKQLEEAKGSPLTNEEKAEYYKTVLPIAQNYGLWEAGPEAVSNAITIGVGKFVFGFGKQAAKKLVGESIDSANKTIARKVAEKGAAVAGGLGTEIASEGVTSVGQYPEEAKIRQLAATGEVSKGEQPSYPGGYMQAVKDVAPATIALYGMMGTAAGGVKLSTLPFRSQKTPEQIAEDNINLEADRVSRELSIGETDEETKSINAALQTARNNLIAKKEVYTALEPNDPAAQSLGLEIREMEREVVALDNELKKRIGQPLSEPIAEVDRQQIELANLITAPAASEVAAQPTTKTGKQIDPELTNSIGKMVGLRREGGLTLEEGYAYRSVSEGEVGSIVQEGYMVTDPRLIGKAKKPRGQVNQKMFSEFNQDAPNAAYGKGEIIIRAKKENVPTGTKGQAVSENNVEVLTYNGNEWIVQTPAEFAASRNLPTMQAAPVEQVVTPPVEVAPTIAEAAPVEPVVSQEFKDELEMSGVAYDGDTRYSVQQSSNGTFRAERIVNGKKEDIQIGLPDIETAQNVIFNSVGKEVPAITAETPAITTPEIQQQVPSGMSVEESKAYLEERNKSTIFGYPTEDIMAMQQGKQVGRNISPAPVTEQVAPAEAPAPEVAPKVTSEERKIKIARLKEIKAEVLPISEKGDLTEQEAKRYSSLMMEAEGIRFDIRKELDIAKIPTETERDSAIPSDIVKVASDELASNRGAFDAITESAAGVFFGRDTAVDKIMNGKNLNVSPEQLYNSFNKTREVLRQKFGNTIKLYRAQGSQKQKATQNWHSTRSGALQYGEKVVEKDIPIDDILALNVGLTGRYEEFIVGKKPTPAVSETITEPAEPIVKISRGENFSMDGEYNVSIGDKKYRIFKDSESGYWYDAGVREDAVTQGKAIQGMPWLGLLSTETRKDAIAELVNKYKKEPITPAVSETITKPAAAPTGIAVGNRVKLGKSPQTYTIEEVIPQSANDKKFGEQYYNVKNEKTGETQVVEKNDMKPVSSRRRKMASEPDPLPENERYGQVKLNQRIQRYFGGKIPDRVYVVDDAVDKEKNYQAAYYPDLGILIVNNAYIKKNANVGDIIAHELGHYAFGDKKFKAAFDKFYNSLSPEDKAKIDKIVEESYNEETEESQIEESKVIAFTSYTIVNPQRRSLWNAVLDALKAFANKVFGKNFQMSDPNRTALAILSTAKKRFAAGEEIVREDIQARKMAAQTQDARFAELEARAKAGDKEAEAEAQRMVDEAAKKAGYDIGPVWHGTNTDIKEFDKRKVREGRFGKGFYFTSNIESAESYAADSVRMKGGEQIVKPYYLKNPFNYKNAIYVASKPSEIKSADPFTYDDAGNLIQLSERFQSSEPDIRRMAVEADKEQIKGEKIGPPKKTPEGIIAKTQELLRKQFDPSKVTEQNTTEAFRALGRLMGKSGTDFAKELNDIGRVVDESGAASEISMGAALFINDLFEYSIRLSAEGNKKLLGIMLSNINKLPTAGIGVSQAARDLRARLEIAQRFLTMGQAEQDAYTNYVAEFIYQPNPTKEQIQSIKDAYAAVDKTAPVTEQELTDEITAVGGRTGTDLVGKINDEFTKATEKGKEKRKTEEQELDKEYKKIQKQADAEIEKLAKIQSDTPSFDPAVRQIINEVRAIVANDLKQRPDMESKADWKSALIAKLQQVGVEPAAAGILADIVWRQHEINSLSRELSSINKAIEKGPISEIVKAIKDTPLEDQQKPNWRYEVMRDYLRKAGLPLAQAERIAKLMDISLQKRFTMAQEQAFTDAISKSAPWKTGDTRSRRAFQKVLQALRAGALDPARNVLSDMAALNGWTGFTPEQYKALLKNDAILSDPESADATKAEAHKAIQDIISKAKLPIRARDVIGQFYDAQALSGIPTMTVNIFSPAGMAVKNALTQSLNGLLTARPEQITAALTTFIDSIKSWANTVAFSFKNNVTVYSNVEYLVNDEGLLKLYKRGVDQFNKGKTPRERADGVKNMMIGMMDYVRRVLNALDYGAIASLQNQAVSKYALAAMQAKGMSSKDGAKMLNAMMEEKRNFYNDQIAIGTDKNKAAVLADEFFVSSWRQALTDAKLPAQQVMDAALNDAMSAVGRNRQSLDAFREEETNTRDGGVISYPALWLLETMANAANKADNQVVKLFSRMIYGFAVVPARVFRETAWFSPYGAVRFAYDYIAKKMGKTSPYAQSLGNDLQYRQRLTETITGSIVLLGFLAAMSSSTEDEEDEKPFKIVVTGNGPLRSEDPQYYDSWTKKHKANTVSVYFGKTKFTINTMRGFEAFAWPAMMLGAVDDWHIRRKQKRETNTPMQMGDAAIIGGNVLSASLRRGPYAFAAKPLFEAYGDRGVESLAKSLAFPAKTLVPVLGASLARNLSDFLNEPVDRKTLEGALWANVPFIGPAVSPKSLNAFGEPALANEAADKIFKLGVPITFNIPTDRDSVNLHELVLKQGGGPSIPTRNQLAQRLDRQPTNKEYEMFVKEYGAKISSDMKRRYEELSNKTPEKYSKSVEKIGNRARDIAERKVREAAKKP